MITKGRKGMALGLVIIIMAVLSILGVALLSLSVASANSIAYQDKSKQAYYLARSGADAVSTHLIRNPADVKDIFAKTSENNTHFDNGNFKVKVEENGNLINVTGTGNVSGVEKSTTAVITRLTIGEMIDKAIYSNSPLDISGMKVEGDIQSGGNINFKTNGSHAYDTKKNSALSNNPKHIETTFPPNLNYYSNKDLKVLGPTIEIKDSYKFDSITIEQNKTLKIIANDEVVNIVVNTLEAKGNINIETTGKGRVNIFVITRMEVKTKGNINNDDPNKLSIYMQKGSVFDMQANIKVFAYVIAPEADAVIQSNQSTIYGALIANTLTKNESNGANGSVVYVPPKGSSEFDPNMKAYKMLRWEE